MLGQLLSFGASMLFGGGGGGGQQQPAQDTGSRAITATAASELPTLPAATVRNQMQVTPYQFTPAAVVTQPGAVGNAATAAHPMNALLGMPTSKSNDAWYAAWQDTMRKQQQAQADEMERQAHMDVARSNPVYGIGYGLGTGVAKLFNFGGK